MVRSLLLAAVFTAGHSAARAQAQGDVPALWKELAASRTAGELARAEATAGKLVDALQPSAKDFSLGVQLNSALHNRASLRYNRGDFAGAEADLLASVEQAKAIGLPPGLPAQAMPPMQAMVDERVRLSLRGLMNFHLAAGDLERATRAFEEADAIPPSWKKQGETGVMAAHQILAAEVTSLAGTFHRATGDYTRAAEAIVARVKEIDGAWAEIVREAGGVENTSSDRTKMNWLRARSNLLMDLAEIASLRERHEEAVGFCEESRKSAREMLPLYRRWAEEAMQPGGPVPPETIRKSLKNVEASAHYLMHERAALIFRAAGREQEALGLMLEGLAERDGKDGPQRFLTLDFNVIRPGESLKLVGDLEAILGNTAAAADHYLEAIALTKQHFPPGHPAVMEIEESRALLVHFAGDEAEAGRLAREVLAMRMRHLEEVLAFADEPMRLAYRSSVDPWSLFASLDLPEELATVVLRTKGVVLESLLEDRGIAARNTDPDLAETIEALEVVRRRLMEHLLAGGTESEERIAGLRSRISELESRMIAGAGADGPRRSRKAIRTDLAEVVEVLPEGGALIEFIRYRHFNAPGRFENRYGAIVIRTDGPPVWVPLDPAAAVEEAMALYARAVRAQPADGEMEAFLTALGRGIWDPLVPHLPEEGKPLILSPDGDLNFLSFATLLGPGGRLVGEVWPITYVSSGRDLLRTTRPERREAMEIVANPDFETPSTTAVAAVRDSGGGAAIAMRGVLGRIGLSPLPGTKEEATALSELVAGRWGWQISSHLETSADEKAVNAVRSPGVLHLATHGFYLPRTGRTDALERARGYWLEAGEAARAPVLESFSDVVLDQPMHRSGIALTGAAATLREWSAGRILETSNDGILTAAEMARLDLAGTWLVVLSACETGLGEARSGEGVLGMRRGLLEAGAQHLLLTLWPVADAETASYMLEFYQALEGGGISPVEAAPAVQAAALKRIREEQGLTAAVKLAGPFVLSFRN
ncbi:MAG: CHAT domain-containing protein [Verrucomicrobiales bacterium]|nr:CHAT domain-containing protein [Verrucomicrobiales bacterium]